MNQAQRKFLIDKINSKVNQKVKELEKSLKDSPSLSNHLFTELLAGTLKLKSHEHILASLKTLAMNAKEGSDWLSGESSGRWSSNTGKISLRYADLVELPENYITIKTEVTEHNLKIQQEITDLKIQAETLETRIQLASDKTLQKMINEIDDMGDISLMDAKIKLLN